jgi:hypothetical protein
MTASEWLTPDDVVPLLLQACPSFAEPWSRSLWRNLATDPPGARLHYADASDFVRHIVGLLVKGETAELPSVFAVIERLLIDGDADARELAQIGYLEDFQIIGGNTAGVSPERDVRPLLGGRSEAAWRELNRMWGGAVT